MSQASRPEAPGPVAECPADAYGQRLPLAFDRLFSAMNAMGTIWILGLMVLINLDVIGRNLMNAPVRGVTEMVSLSIVGIVFLQLADTLRSGRFTRAEVLLEYLRRKNPQVCDAVQAVFHLTGLALMVVILLASWTPLADAVRIREYIGAVGDFQIPVWPVRLITLLGLLATALCFCLLAILDVQRMLCRGAK